MSIVVIGVVIPLLTCFLPTMIFIKQKQNLRLAMAELSCMHAQLQEQSSRDALTGLLHRQAFFDRLRGAQRRAGSGAFAMIDIDHFKTINGSFGHNEGDRALVLVAEALRTALPADGLVARFGGEEFCAYYPAATAEAAARTAEMLRLALERIRFVPRGKQHCITASLGVTFDKGGPLATLVDFADTALYEAKRGGRNQVVTSDLPTSANDEIAA